MRAIHLLPLTLTMALVAQSPKALAPAPKTEAKAEKKDASKDSLEAQAARQTFGQVLDSVSNGWFGPAYKDVKYVDLDGNVNVTLSAAALNAKVDQTSQGQVKANAIKEGRASIHVKSTYYANADFKTEMNGDFGHLIYTRVGNKGFLYSREQNAYTTRVEPSPADAPVSFMGWFQQVINDVRDVYVKGSTFRASFGKETSLNGHELQTLTFYAPTGPYDIKKREQSLGETLGFWKRGRLDVAFDKTTRLPYLMDYSNEEQGVRTRMEFTYDGNGKLQHVALSNQSRGFEGPGSLRVAYGPDGLPSSVACELVSKEKKVAFDLNLAWNKGRKSIASVPPPTASKKGQEELTTLVLVGAAGNILELQRMGLNFRAFKAVGGK